MRNLEPFKGIGLVLNVLWIAGSFAFVGGWLLGLAVAVLPSALYAFWATGR